MSTKLDDIYYFQYMKTHKPSIYSLAKDVQDLSQTNASDKDIFQAKLDKLATVPGGNAEQRRMAVDLLCEFQTFKSLSDDGVSPCWIKETTDASPDIKYLKDGIPYPVEVKHINPPREEDVALSRGVSVSGFFNPAWADTIITKRFKRLKLTK